ncbi:MAG: GAF domain-containing protein, partial [Chloroflexi bacterium]|nr:GAF domain-containing protein [Chloroflexota bacterium]
MQQSLQSSLEQRYSRNAQVINIILMASTLPTAALFGYLAYTGNQPQLYVPMLVVVVTFFFYFYTLSLIRHEKRNQAVFLILAALLVNVLMPVIIVKGVGGVAAAAIALLTLSIIGQAMPPRYATSGIILAVLFSILMLALDNVVPGENRIEVPGLELYMPFVIGMVSFPLVIGFIRSFSNFSLQTKITLGILLTGGITVSTLVVFGLNRMNFIGGFLADKYEENVTGQTEEEILTVTNREADEIDEIFLEIRGDLVALAEFRSELDQQQTHLEEGIYWNATDRLLQLPGGQYGNSSLDISSVYIPNTYAVTEEMFADLNTSVYLNLLAPGFLDAHPEAVAVYYVSSLGYTVYYPNIDLAQNVPPDFDPTQQTFFTIAKPLSDLKREPQLTQPYQDPAGAGMVVTISVPVYNGDTFEGVISADVQLNKVKELVSQIQVGETGIPLLVGRNGLVLAMTDAGYNYFGLEPEVIPFNESPRQTIFDSELPGTTDLGMRMFGTQSGLSIIEVNGVETYISVADLETTGYKLVFIAPVSELNQEAVALRTNINNEVTQTIQRATIILAVLFFGAFIVSLGVGQLITRPLKRLTETVEQIAVGNLSSRANVETGDESGTLAKSFNIMADQLTETLQGLEGRIAERTSELETLSRSSAYRATRFESIARISRIISSTRAIDQLLPQIAEIISGELGYYHVGIFLIDVHREYAVLVAANSEGGKVMLGRSHRLRVGETGIVGYVSQSGAPRVALDVGQDAVYFNNPDLPETHSEIALPLRSGSEIIGALDVQSKQTNAFSEEDVNILSVLADQVSIAIQNARSFQQSLDALEKAERAAAQLSEQQWSQ